METSEEDLSIPLSKPSRAERWKRSIAARFRRQIAKFAKNAHMYKEEEESMERLKAKKLLEKQKKQKRKKSVDKSTDSV